MDNLVEPFDSAVHAHRRSSLPLSASILAITAASAFFAAPALADPGDKFQVKPEEYDPLRQAERCVPRFQTTRITDVAPAL